MVRRSCETKLCSDASPTTAPPPPTGPRSAGRRAPPRRRGAAAPPAKLGASAGAPRSPGLRPEARTARGRETPSAGCSTVVRRPIGKACHRCYKQVEMLDFRILGPLEVREEGRVLPLGGQKQRALLALLALAGGRTVSRERLIDALWGERPPRTAGTSLQNLLSQLRKLLGPEVLVTKPPGYALAIDREQLDSERFVGLVESARSRGPQRRAEALRQALALWRGPPLADLYFESFAQPEIARLEELRLAAVEDRIEAEAAAGADAELVGELESLVREHPTRERLRGQLMRALYR